MCIRSFLKSEISWKHQEHEILISSLQNWSITDFTRMPLKMMVVTENCIYGHFHPAVMLLIGNMLELIRLDKVIAKSQGDRSWKSSRPPCLAILESTKRTTRVNWSGSALCKLYLLNCTITCSSLCVWTAILTPNSGFAFRVMSSEIPLL